VSLHPNCKKHLKKVPRLKQNTTCKHEYLRRGLTRPNDVSGKIQEHSGNIQGTIKELLGIVQGTFREHSGSIQGTFREYSGNIQRTFREHCVRVEEDAGEPPSQQQEALKGKYQRLHRIQHPGNIQGELSGRP
jgi:hypothetical protein